MNSKDTLVVDQFTRPADTTAYAINDVVGDNTLRSFSLGNIEGGTTGIITKAIVMSSNSALTARFRLHLYKSAITAIADNAACTILYTNRELYIGSIDLPSQYTSGSGSTASFSENITDVLSFDMTDYGPNIYYLLETLDVYTPVSASTYYIRLAVTKND